ncbi:hypothetical protein SLEP1_g22708 [Rubroshorea leprosula]|uniref:Uncharacterized protein n=1 Tax=Rubroshorea leprosula TaxID=152421 RepID=A0AAV5JJ96_9ROSI|nr:hypothetical protein SLEP1_g22708 [Rubroshorea leprosula]
MRGNIILARFCSSSPFFPLQPKKKPSHHRRLPLRKIGEQPDFILLFWSKNKIGALKSSPLQESFRICLALLLTAGCSCFVGANCFDFLPRESPCTCRLPSPNLQSGFCLLNSGSETEDRETTGSDELEG